MASEQRHNSFLLQAAQGWVSMRQRSHHLVAPGVYVKGYRNSFLVI